MNWREYKNVQQSWILKNVLSCILYLCHNEDVRYEAGNWDYSRTLFLGDAYFICFIVCEVMTNEIIWSCEREKVRLLNRIWALTGCINTTDGTFVQIHRPHIEQQRGYYNGRRKMYCFNNILVDNDGFITYISRSFAGSFHDVICLRGSCLERNWQIYFKVDPDSPHPVKYLPGNPGYSGMDHFIFRKFDGREIENCNYSIIRLGRATIMNGDPILAIRSIDIFFSGRVIPWPLSLNRESLIGCATRRLSSSATFTPIT